MQDFRQIYDSIKTIAVVGLSDKPERPSYQVADYLKRQGYKIIPVNPTIEASLGEKSYPSLDQVSEPIDVVDVFRQPQFVDEIMAAAIKIGAKVVWLQEGIINPAAAQKGHLAGLTVVMDRCMMKEHKKLFKEEQNLQ